MITRRPGPVEVRIRNGRWGSGRETGHLEHGHRTHFRAGGTTQGGVVVGLDDHREVFVPDDALDLHGVQRVDRPVDGPADKEVSKGAARELGNGRIALNGFFPSRQPSLRHEVLDKP